MKNLIKIIGLCLLSLNIYAQALQSGDRVVLNVTSGNDYRGRYSYAFGGGQLFTRSKILTEQNDKYQAFIIQRIDGGNEIRNNAKVYLITDDGLYLNCYDSNGIMSTKRTHSDNPAISDEIFTIQFQEGNRFYNNEIKKVKFLTRRGLTIGIYNRVPSALPYDTRSDDGSDVLLADNRPEKFILRNSPMPTAVETAESLSTIIAQAIAAKEESMGWNRDGHTKSYNIRTAGRTGYVQYYSFAGRKTAIYHFPNRGTYAMDTAEMTAYDAAGQDKFAFVASDPKPCGSGCGYNDIIQVGNYLEGIIIGDKLVYGEIYKKYKALGRWNSVLGRPTSSEVPGQNNLPDKGRFSHFERGLITFTGNTGANAIWGKVLRMWEKTDWERGWLGFPTQSCNPNSSSQVVVFERGSIDAGSGCDSYNNKGYYTDISGKVVGGKPCY